MANEPLFGFNLQQKKSLMDYLASQGGSTTVTSAQITDATTVGRNVLTAATAAAARAAIGAGTSDLTIGTTATTAKAGNYTPPNATTTVKGLVNQAAARADSTATDVDGLVTDFNDLLAKLRTAGILA